MRSISSSGVRANSSALVVTTIVSAGAGKAVGEDAALQIFAKGLADVGLGGVVVALAVELAGTGQLKPGLKMFGYGSWGSASASWVPDDTRFISSIMHLSAASG